jgi:ATP-binding cassette subfamily B (MDR/TAP) protein 1
VKRVGKEEAEEFARAGAVAEEALSSIRIVAAFAGEQKEISRYNENLARARKTGIKASFITALSQGISWMLIFIFAGVLIWYAGILVAAGDIDPGAIAQVMQCMISGTRALSWAIGSLEIISDAQGAAYGIFEIIDHVKN